MPLGTELRGHGDPLAAPGPARLAVASYRSHLMTERKKSEMVNAHRYGDSRTTQWLSHGITSQAAATTTSAVGFLTSSRRNPVRASGLVAFEPVSDLGLRRDAERDVRAHLLLGQPQ